MATKVRARLRAMMPAKTRAMPTRSARQTPTNYPTRTGRPTATTPRTARESDSDESGVEESDSGGSDVESPDTEEPDVDAGSDVAGDVYKRIFISGCRPRLPLNSFADEHVPVVERLGDGVCEGPEVLRVPAVVRDQGIERVVVAAFRTRARAGRRPGPRGPGGRARSRFPSIGFSPPESPIRLQGT